MIGKESRTNSAFMEGKIDFDQNTVYKNFSPPMEDFSMEYSKQLTINNDVAISWIGTAARAISLKHV